MSEITVNPFVGSLSKRIFGTAAMDDVHILACHINALNRKTENKTKALQPHGVDLSSFMSLTEIKSNADYITMVATSFNSKLVSLENSFTNISEIRIYQVIISQARTLRTKLNKLMSAVESLLEKK